MKLSIAFGDVTIKDLEAVLAEVVAIYDASYKELRIEHDHQEFMTDIIAHKHKNAINALTQMIEASADIEESIPDWVHQLQPATHTLQEYFAHGADLYSAFSQFISDKKELEAYREKHKFFSRRTEKEQLSYLACIH